MDKYQEFLIKLVQAYKLCPDSDFILLTLLSCGEDGYPQANGIDWSERFDAIIRHGKEANILYSLWTENIQKNNVYPSEYELSRIDDFGKLVGIPYRAKIEQLIRFSKFKQALSAKKEG